MKFAPLLLLAAALPAWPSEPRYTDELWAAIEPIYSKTLDHPFLKGLADGTLPREKFDFYLRQDALYLGIFGQALNELASKAPREEWSVTLSQHAIDCLKERMQAPADRMAPVNYAYSNHLLAAVHRKSFAEGLAALLPCYWIYWEVGKELKKRGSKNPDYQRWIDQYADPSYEKTVAVVIRMMNAEAARLTPEQRQSAREQFILSARYEYLFWDMAWREEQWLP